MLTAGFVLVGGRSSRMGRDKALLPWNSYSLAGGLAGLVAAVAGNAALVGEPQRYRRLGFDCLPDVRPGLGPLAGIEAALASQRGELNLIVACDMPGLSTELLARLLRYAEQSDAPCVMTRDVSGQVHPLCAVYRSSCLAEVSNALDVGQLRVQALGERLAAATFEIDQFLWNVNTPQEWNAWEQQDHGH